MPNAAGLYVEYYTFMISIWIYSTCENIDFSVSKEGINLSVIYLGSCLVFEPAEGSSANTCTSLERPM